MAFSRIRAQASIGDASLKAPDHSVALWGAPVDPVLPFLTVALQWQRELASSENVPATPVPAGIPTGGPAPGTLIS